MRGYDYKSDGIYYVTICTEDRQMLFGDVKNRVMILSAVGEMIQKAWEHIPKYDLRISLDEFIVMPDHVHGIIVLESGLSPNCGQGQCPAPTVSLSSIVGRFKSWTTNAYTAGVKQHNWPSLRRRLWQRNYYERIIRSEKELHNVREYIRNNPKN
jgi:putative transposase